MKIVDLSVDVAGRFAAKLFAMAGQAVIRPSLRDDPNPASRSQTLDLYLDAHKTIVPLADDEPLASLLADADLVFTSFDAGRHVGLASKPLGLPTSCVQVTTSSFGAWGPYSTFRGGPLADWASGGYAAITGEPDREPLIGPETLCGYAAGYTAAVAAEAALAERRRSGQGQTVDVSTMEAMLCLHQTTFSRASAGFIRQRTGRYTEVYPLTVLPCRDGYVSLGVVSDGEFDRFAIAIERLDLAADERFHDQAARWANRDALDLELMEFLSRHDADFIVDLLQTRTVPAAKVTGPREILSNPQLLHRGFWDRPEGPDGPAMPGNPAPPMQVFASHQSTARPRQCDDGVGERNKRASLPLSGLLVLDFTAFWAGPSATRFLADLGADVVWVERPRSRVDADVTAWDPAAVTQHLFHQKMNRNKRSVVLDLDSPDGLARALELTRRADVLVENFRPGVADRLGLGSKALCTGNPSLVYVSLYGFGGSGPWGAWRSYGPNIEAASSIEYRTGYRDGEPLRLGHALPDGLGGLAGALAALRGLREREERGRGGWFDISQLEVYAAVSGEEILAASKSDAPFPRIGNRSRVGAIQGSFPCRGDDQWVMIRLADRSDLERFAATTQNPRITQLPPETSLDEMEALICAYTGSRDKHEVTRTLQAVAIEAFPVLDAAELVADPHLAERGFFVKFQAGGRECPLPGSPIKASRRLTDPEGRAPRFNEHHEDVLKLTNAG